jgi:NADPH-ferrihemoprotein reductase
MIPNDEASYKVPCFVRRSQFRLPNRPQTPVIMIGPGTGLAPFRGFIQERAWQKEEGKPVGETLLFFGCRHQDKGSILRNSISAENFVDKFPSST